MKVTNIRSTGMVVNKPQGHIYTEPLQFAVQQEKQVEALVGETRRHGGGGLL